MSALDERKSLDAAVTAWRRVVFGQRQSIRRPQPPTPQATPPEEKREQAS